MKNLDRILNMALVVAVVLFVASYFLKENTPPQKAGFAPVELSSALPNIQPASVSVLRASALEAFKALSWEQLDAAVNDGSGKPTLLVVFASWCPYCEKMMPVISELAVTEKERLNVLVISIDADLGAIQRYVAAHSPALSFPVYLHSTNEEKALLQTFLYQKQLNFTGGIPYMAFFDKGTPVQQFGGFVERKILTDTLDRIELPQNTTNDSM